MSESHTQLRSLVDRVLRLKEEQDNLSIDIREIYAEAKSQGFDKTVMGQVVATLRKMEKDGSKFDEQASVFAAYIAAYQSAQATLKVAA